MPFHRQRRWQPCEAWRIVQYSAGKPSNQTWCSWPRPLPGITFHARLAWSLQILQVLMDHFSGLLITDGWSSRDSETSSRTLLCVSVPLNSKMHLIRLDLCKVKAHWFPRKTKPSSVQPTCKSLPATDSLSILRDWRHFFFFLVSVLFSTFFISILKGRRRAFSEDQTSSQKIGNA